MPFATSPLSQSAGLDQIWNFLDCRWRAPRLSGCNSICNSNPSFQHVWWSLISHYVKNCNSKPQNYKNILHIAWHTVMDVWASYFGPKACCHEKFHGETAKRQIQWIKKTSNVKRFPVLPRKLLLRICATVTTPRYWVSKSIDFS